MGAFLCARRSLQQKKRSVRWSYISEKEWDMVEFQIGMVSLLCLLVHRPSESINRGQMRLGIWQKIQHNIVVVSIHC